MIDSKPDRRAATVVLLRDRPAAHPELLMVQRAHSMAFAAGALVFPGGALDPADFAIAQGLGPALALDERASRVAAIRETLEESGIGLGLPQGFPAPALAAMRAALHDGAPFADLLADHGVTLDIHCLTPFARWHPARVDHVRRVFDTRFYLARAPRGQEATADATENIRLFWADAAAVIAACDAGDGLIIFPTRRNLERLAQFADCAAAIAHAMATPVETVTPWLEDRDGVPHLCIPTHLGYPITSEPFANVPRN
ncbi:NUDIX domain-containing protein [Sphingobium sp. AN641]|uniref:NUDIX hydrolase n=1 Tax=Sphingobium sp. AN641 TaxID=3133443 RepID=UPI0030C1150A